MKSHLQSYPCPLQKREEAVRNQTLKPPVSTSLIGGAGLLLPFIHSPLHYWIED